MSKKQTYYWELKSIGDRECILIRTTSFSGENEVMITPAKSTDREIKETIDALLENEDSYNINKYLIRIGKEPEDFEDIYLSQLPETKTMKIEKKKES